MRKIWWALVMVISLALLGAPQAFAGGKAKGQGNGAQIAGTQGQWVNNQPPGWTGHGRKQGWNKNGPGVMPGGLQKNKDTKGKYPKGLQKTL